MNKFFCNYHLIVNTTAPDVIDVILSRLNKEQDIFKAPAALQPYHKVPHQTEVFGELQLPVMGFDNVLMWLLKCLQFDFYGWHISGDFENEILLKASKFRDSSICYASITLSAWG
jgi:hypothetical protein